MTRVDCSGHNTRWRRWVHSTLPGVMLAVSLAGCGNLSVIEGFLNQTADFGSSDVGPVAGASVTSGNRGTVRVVIENNTPFRAVFTIGAFDNTDARSTPAFFQFSPDSQFIAPNAPQTIEGNANSGVFELPCARVFSIGSRTLIDLIARNPGPQPDAIDEAALVDGVGFSDVPLGDTNDASPDQGFARGFEALLGVDFNCGSLLYITFEFNDVGPDAFRVTESVIPSQTTR